MKHSGILGYSVLLIVSPPFYRSTCPDLWHSTNVGYSMLVYQYNIVSQKRFGQKEVLYPCRSIVAPAQTAFHQYCVQNVSWLVSYRQSKMFWPKRGIVTPLKHACSASPHPFDRLYTSHNLSIPYKHLLLPLTTSQVVTLRGGHLRNKHDVISLLLIAHLFRFPL